MTLPQLLETFEQVFWKVRSSLNATSKWPEKETEEHVRKLLKQMANAEKESQDFSYPFTAVAHEISTDKTIDITYIKFSAIFNSTIKDKDHLERVRIEVKFIGTDGTFVIEGFTYNLIKPLLYAVYDHCQRVNKATKKEADPKTAVKF